MTGSEKSLASLKLHPLQAHLPAEDIKRIAEQTMITAVNQVTSCFDSLTSTPSVLCRGYVS